MKVLLSIVILSGILSLSVHAQEIIRLDQSNARNQSITVQSAESILRQQLNLTNPTSFKQIETKTDNLGISHRRFQEYYQDVKVEYGGYTLNFKEKDPLSIVHHVKPFALNSVKASISEEEALSIALKNVGASKYMWQRADQKEIALKMSDGKSATFYPSGELVIVPNFESKDRKTLMKPVLAYKFDIYAEEPLSRAYIYVDATNGEIVHINQIIKHAEAEGTFDTRYSNNRTSKTDAYNSSYRLRDYTRGNGIETYDMNTGTNYNSAVDFVDSDNNWTSAEWDNTEKDNAALDAHWGAQMTYDYFSTSFNRDSWDGNGAAIKSYVHYDKAYDNAFWNGSVMTYGDGSGTYFDALTSLDVAAHEIGHAICEKTAGLVYERESGALNEGFSDIWGACVEAYAAPEKDEWLIGEDIERRTNNQALRSMRDPKSEGQPDTYGGTNWRNPNCGTPTRSNDYCGVHTNSGVLNHWFYILVEGKSSTNDIGSAYSVNGIGMDKAGAIAYRTEAVYLSATSTFANARTFSIQSAIDLYGEGSNEVIQTTNAWYAVGVGEQYGETSAYCASRGNDASYEWIASVAVGDMLNTTGSNGGYTNFSSSKSVTLAAGTSYDVSLAPGFASTSYDEYWKIWIDLNADGDFEDADELVFDAGGLTKTTVTGTLKIPTSTAATTTRMRVSMKYEGTQTVCESFSYGEVEDYEVVITSGTPEVCDAPTTLAVNNLTVSSVDVSWDVVSTGNNYAIQLKETGGTWSTYTASTNSASFTDLTANTSYEVRVATNCTSSTSDYSEAVVFTTLEEVITPVNYCASAGNNDSYFWIDDLRVGGLSNSTSKDGGYGDYTSLSVGTITRGASETISFSAGYRNTRYTVYWSVWIDYNQDGDFNDANELFVQGSSSSQNLLSSSQVIPSEAVLGTTRMRVAMKYGAASTPCESFTYGEVEDYLVTITSGSSINRVASLSVEKGETLESSLQLKEVSLYPNPSNTIVNINAELFNGNGTIEIYGINGNKVLSMPVESQKTTIPVYLLKKGMYLMKISNELEAQTKKFIVK
ncbi:M4 family metallopeptidase [Flammeovirga kamogawensis]|uniref:M4 family metallopeptidase n=1 Tax=Flammeovirga kamogawensis TaxID=373891 RepID=A0ABX8GQE7_9BACT|nr:M4 family metallopeptidase [Flammeovirga kamogawensis]MBB6463435.1 Zn-dependent metalloprotease [Flammeovirga kamogawensis]QWG05639.1 M4 family metallopeptidase [Flammeovirga kamogawensis]TRX67470.1 T9SS type A sorting domain-containing protein [Flammeovirga kamogawensis]